MLDDLDLEEIARLIMEGYTSGHLDNGEGKAISWSLSTEVYEDSEVSI